MPACHLGLLEQGSANAEGQDAQGFVGHRVYPIFSVLVVASTAGAPFPLFIPLLPLQPSEMQTPFLAHGPF